MEFDTSDLYSALLQVDGTRISLYELANWKNGLAFKKIDFADIGLPIIKIAELKNGISSSTTYSDKNYGDEVFLTSGDFVFSWSGNPQTSIDIFRYRLPDGWLNQHIFKVIPNASMIDKEYFFYLMKHLKSNFTQIATNKQTTGLGHVTIADLKRMNVSVPNLKYQKECVTTLKAIDDKIEMNDAINENLAA